MKHFFLIAVVVMAITAPAFAGESRYTMDNLTATSFTGGINVKVDANRLMTLSELWIVPPRVNPNHDKWEAKSVKLFSGILQMSTDNGLVLNQAVVDGKVSETLYDLGTELGGPVVEHFWLRGTNGKKVDYPVLFGANNLWICSRANSDGTPNLETLFIGMVFYPKTDKHPEGVILPLKVVLQVLNKKIDGTYYPQHKRPELALTNVEMERAIALKQ